MVKNKFFKRYKSGLFAILLILGIIALVIGVDILTKVLTDGKSILVLPSFFNFISVHNTGGSWSILNEHTWILITLTFVFLIAFCIFNYFFKQRTTLYLVVFSLVFGGAIGNLIDRLFLGYVRDFIALDFINFPVFNIADMCLCAGVIVLLVFFLFLYPKYNKKYLKTKQKFALAKKLKKVSYGL